ncbi:MAG: choline/carnitine O-acyltransferase [Coriobacteriia bacterium]|nr:choline/carnitine O-acyltransferase [Coriobacteriia bacterium]
MLLHDNDAHASALPLPELMGTREAFKARVKPLVSDQVFADTCKALEDEELEELHKLLVDWKQSKIKNESWLKQVWDDNYLCYRGSLPLGLNFSYELYEKYELATLIHGIAAVIQKLRLETLAPEPIKDGYFSMDPYSRLFYTRIPSLIRDMLIPCDLTQSKIAVVYKGSWSILSLTDAAGKLASPEAIKNALLSIQSGELQSTELGAITVADRDTAFQLRTALQEKSLNRFSLESLERSLFTVCLDNTRAYKDLLLGDARNRWFDKSLQIISNESFIGASFEHASCDGRVWSYFLAQVDAYLSSADLGSDTPELATELLRWSINPELRALLQKECEIYQGCAHDISLSSRSISVLTKNDIKGMACSPDAFAQFTFLAAYRSFTGRVVSAYGAISTGCFFEGRTESYRSASADMVAALDSFESRSPNFPEKLIQASATHSKNIKDALSLGGPERHLTGLMTMAALQDSALPGLFEDTGYLTLKHDIISTSSTTNALIKHFAFCPVVADGLGIGYGLTHEAFELVVSATKGSCIDPVLFIDAVENICSTVKNWNR